MFQVFVVFVNRVGSEGELHFWGGSHVVDPWGEVVAQAKQDIEEVLTVDIDLPRSLDDAGRSHWSRKRGSG